MFPVHAMKAYRESRGVAPLILNLSITWRRVGNFTSRSHYPRTEPRYPLNRRLRGPQSRCGRFWRREIYPAPTGIRAPDRTAPSLVAIPTELRWLQSVKLPAPIFTTLAITHIICASANCATYKTQATFHLDPDGVHRVHQHKIPQ
jgi:hypothetical protein